MKLIYKGKFDGDENSLPSSEPVEGAVMFKEAADMKQFAILVNVLAVVVMGIAFVLFFWRGGVMAFSFWGYLLFMLSLVPHELLHGLCFKENVYLYTNWKQGMLFVTGPEHLSKARFVFMSLLPNILFGFLPLLIFLIDPSHNILGTFGGIRNSITHLFKKAFQLFAVGKVLLTSVSMNVSKMFAFPFGNDFAHFFNIVYFGH